jgi:hypothetical protein
MIKYILQLIVMIGDLMIIAACTFCIYFNWWNPVAYVAAGVGYCSWKRSGGFVAWKPRMVKKFLKNAKKSGL